jgi:hypothetical protein
LESSVRTFPDGDAGGVEPKDGIDEPEIPLKGGDRTGSGSAGYKDEMVDIFSSVILKL